jgi:hypothetical protein
VAGELRAVSEGVGARLVAAEADLEAALSGRTVAEAKVEKLQQYMQVMGLYSTRECVRSRRICV